MKNLKKTLWAVIGLSVVCGSLSAAWAGEWVAVNSGTVRHLFAVWGTSMDDLVVVGQNGLILNYDGSKWSSAASPSLVSLNGVWGMSASEIYAVGRDGTIIEYNGSYWDDMESPTTQVLNAIWGASDDEVFAVGEALDKTTIIQYDGDDWTSRGATGIHSLYSVWGDSRKDVFAVGYGGAAFYYNGNLWSAMESNTDESLNGVWCASPTQVYAVGDVGTIMYYNGSEWGEMESGITSGLLGVWGSGATDVYAVGSNGVILHYDGVEWTPMSSGTTQKLLAVWGLSETEVLVLGQGGTLLQYSAAPADTTTTTAADNDTDTTTTTAADNDTDTTTTTAAPASTSTSSVPEAEEVDFVGTPSSGYAPLTVRFICLCPEDVESHEWDFGDLSEPSAETEPTHTYTRPGTYSVFLTVTLADGSTQTAIGENYISAWPRRPCAFESALEEENLQKARTLRGSLIRSPRGRALVARYYRNAAEIAGLFEQMPEMKARFKQLFAQYLPALKACLSSGRAMPAGQDLQPLRDFLLALSRAGSPGLQTDIHVTLKELDQGCLLDLPANDPS